MILSKWWNKINYNLREHVNPIMAPFRLKRIKYNKDFTIISNNCWGGHVYRYFNLSYSSPTVGMYFFAEDYIRFISNLKKYMEMDMVFITAKESIHYQEIVDKHPSSLNKPIGRLGDVEIVFLHSKSREEALIKWNRRKKRVNYDNLVVKMSEMNGCTMEHLRLFDALPYKKKFVFVTKDYGLASQVIYKECMGMSEIDNDTILFRKYVNLENLINGCPFKKHQK